ncbi:DNA cytosine methyltransferase [Neorhizobium galegae]|uniref:DNA (cytosine-5-)-methyltransferase n=1 Tax=Neorhizobium galegae bv. officinalis TaxID=323656 RepID=A0A0T7GIF3_NEOGA|nr:DNA cytosine methyltransferase [Neorhizobium galegae]CDZ46986.1 Cytosine-specific methyltransferase [Neorhizobium galegae bv. officinalis]
MQAVELFAGAGGLGIGISRAGFRPQRIVEWNRHCQATLKANALDKESEAGHWPTHVDSDVRDVDFSDLEGKLDLVSGGPPCQPFSLGGRHQAHADSRDMFPEAVRAIREAKPRAFIFENVRGLTRQSFRNYFEYIRLQMQYPELTSRKEEDWAEHLSRLERHHNSKRGSRGLEYTLLTEVLNAANFGVPQKRERVFFVGFRNDVKAGWTFPTQTHSYEALLFDQIHGTYFDRHEVERRDRLVSERAKTRVLYADGMREGMLPWKTVRDAIKDLPDPERNPVLASRHSSHRLQPGARAYPGHTGSPLDEPAKTLKAGVHGVPGGENMLARPDGSVRYFTVRESARLQTFPDNYKIEGVWSEAMRQLGNAVPVTLAETVARSVAASLSNRG